jgi:hypothetical protein
MVPADTASAAAISGWPRKARAAVVLKTAPLKPSVFSVSKAPNPERAPLPKSGSNSCSYSPEDEFRGPSLVSDLSGVSAVTRPAASAGAGGVIGPCAWNLGDRLSFVVPLAAIFALAERMARIERRLEIAASPKN